MGKRKDVMEVICPKCRHTEIIHLPKEGIPKCPDCKNVQMIIRELLTEGKAY